MSFLQNQLAAMKADAGWITLHDFGVLDEVEGKFKETTTTSALLERDTRGATSSGAGTVFACIRVERRSRGSRRQRSFSWPLPDADTTFLIGALDIMQSLAEAPRPERDPRSWIGRCFDRLVGVRLLGFHAWSSPPGFPAGETLEVRIQDTPVGQEADLTRIIPHRGKDWVRIPMSGVHALKEAFKQGPALT